MTDDFKPPVLRLGKNASTGIGQKQTRKPKGLKFQSPKQRARTDALQIKLEAMLNKMHEIYAKEWCQLKEARPDIFTTACEGELVAEHVNGRNVTNPDGFWNLQVGCWKHNGQKGSNHLDCRSHCLKLEFEAMESK